MLNLKKHIKIIALTSTVALAPQAIANTEDAGNSDYKLSNILKNLSGKGYSNIQDIEIEKGILSIEGIKQDGAQFEVDVNPKTGDIVKEKQFEPPKYSIIEVVEQIEADGTLELVEIELDEGVYKVKAKTPDKKEKEFHIDPKTGEKKQEN